MVFGDGDGWTRARLVEETILLDDLEVPRPEVDALPLDGAPWRAVHEAVVTLPSGTARLEVAVVSETDPELGGVLSDWMMKVP